MNLISTYARELHKLELTVYYLSLRTTELVLRGISNGHQNGRGDPCDYAQAAADALSQAPSLLGMQNVDHDAEAANNDHLQLSATSSRQLLRHAADLADALVPALMEAASYSTATSADRIACRRAAVHTSKLHQAAIAQLDTDPNLDSEES